MHKNHKKNLYKYGKIEDTIFRLQEEKVVDKVYDGFGGKQGFRIEGIPVTKIKRMERLLINKKTNFVKKQNDLLELEEKIEEFIDDIPITRDRLIVRGTCIENKKQRELAEELSVERTTISKTLKKYIA